MIGCVIGALAGIIFGNLAFELLIAAPWANRGCCGKHKKGAKR